MARPGHSSTRAALIYQNARRDRNNAIALALGDRQAPDLGILVGAGEGNRSLMTSLEDR
jgi:hypothetical protein